MKIKFSFLALTACLSLLAFCHAASAAEVYGTVDALSGSASISGQNGQSAPVTVGLHIYEGDTIRSAHDGEARINGQTRLIRTFPKSINSDPIH